MILSLINSYNHNKSYNHNNKELYYIMTSVGARLGFNEIPIISWKGKTFTQISSSIQKNIKPPASIQNTMRSQPVNHYRREIASITGITHGNPRISMSVDEMTSPNGYLVISNGDPRCTGVHSTLDFNLTSNTTETTCDTTATCVANNALTRVRSAGMIVKNYNLNRNNDKYYTSTQEYLKSRNRSFQQNQYNYIRQGNSLIPAGNPNTSSNVYSGNGLNHCPLVTINETLNNNVFGYIWIDGTTYTVTIPDGNQYDIGSLNGILAGAMIQNDHYIIRTDTGSKIIPLAFAYNSYYGKIEIQSLAVSSTIFPSNVYNLPIPQSGPLSWSLPSNIICPIIEVLSNGFQNVIGFSSGFYPDSAINIIGGVYSQIPAYTTNQIFLSSLHASILPSYVPVYYKPSNPQFANQGAVDSGTLVDRKRYNTITTAAATLSTAWGNETADALAYGVNPSGINVTAKLKYGIPIQKTPKFNPRTGQMQQCQVRRIPGG